MLSDTTKACVKEISRMALRTQRRGTHHCTLNATLSRRNVHATLEKNATRRARIRHELPDMTKDEHESQSYQGVAIRILYTKADAA